MERLRWGMIGGGEGSQIGFVHRAAAELDRRFELTAGAFDIDPDKSRKMGAFLGLPPDRAHGTWREMLSAEADRPDRLDLVTVATPNATHYEISRAFLNAGFHVFCEKPLTTVPEEARKLERAARAGGLICAVNFGYSGYPLVRHMRSLVLKGELGRIRVIKAEFAAGFLADADLDQNPRIRWRFDPDQAGRSLVMADMGCHAMHLAAFVTGEQIRMLSADLAKGVEGRRLEDDAYVAFRMDGGAIGRLWVSGLAIGRAHGLTLQIFGEKGGMSWEQERPERLKFMKLGRPVQILERGMEGLSADAGEAGRITAGHPEGLVLAFANLYRDIADEIRVRHGGGNCGGASGPFPDAGQGRHMVEVVAAAVESNERAGEWTAVNQQSRAPDG